MLSGLLAFSSATVKAEEGYTIAGDILQVALPLTAISTTLIIEDYNGSIQFLKAFTATTVTTQVLKYSINAERPNGGDRSFPSGHTSAAFSGASFLQRRYGWVYGIPAYAAATYVGWSRVNAEAHYTRDVVAGAIIGIGFTYLFTDPYEERYRLQPVFGRDYYGLHFTACF